jgi:ATP-dependent DNA ligase
MRQNRRHRLLEGSRYTIGALLLGYYDADGRLLYAGRVGTGMPVETLAMLHERLKPLDIPKMALAVVPRRNTRFGPPRLYEADRWLLYAGRVGTGMPVETLAMLHGRLKPPAIPKMALAVAHPLRSYSAITKPPAGCRTLAASGPACRSIRSLCCMSG